MKITQCNEQKFRNDFFPIIVDLWYADRYDAKNEQHFEFLDRKIHTTFENLSVATCVYTDDDKPIGYLWYKHDIGLEGVCFSGKDAHIIQMGLYDEYQNQGVGTYLLNEVCKNIKSNGGECLYTDTYTANWDSMVFYIKKGFIPVGLLPGLNGINDNGQVFLYKVL